MKKYYQFINENLNNDMKPIGSFEIESGKVMISDPCYERGTWCQGILNNVVKGKWNAYIKESDEKEWGTRAAELIAVKDGYKLENLTGWNESGIHVGVDSGQAGIYEDKYYNDNTIVKGPFKYKSSSPEDNITGGIDYVLDKMGMDKETLGKIFQKGDNELKTKFKELRDEYEKTQKKRYRVVEYNWKTNNGEWYDANCVQTLNIKNPPGIYDKEEIEQQLGGCIPFGCVSSAGYGDGSYTCYFITLPGEGKTNLADPYGEENWEDNLPIIAIKIVFIDANLENELYDDYEGGNIPYADEDEYENDDENDG